MADAEADCKQALERLYLYLDGEIPGADCAEIDRHLERCEDCLKHYGFERDVKSLVRSKCVDEAPEGLIARIRATLREI